MSSDYPALVKRGFEAWNAGDRSWILEHMTPDVEWLPPPDDPDGGVYRGHEGVQRFWDEWRSAVGQLAFELEVVESHGADDVVVVARRRGKGAHSGLEVSDTVVQVFSFDQDGRCYRVREFYDRAQALEHVAAEGPERDEGHGPQA